MTPIDLSKKILKIEHVIYPQVIKLFAERKISLKNNKVFFKNKITVDKLFD